MSSAVYDGKSRDFASVAASVLLWSSRTVFGLLTAYPLLSALDATGIGKGPERDAVLFQPGSLLLLEALRVGMPWLSSALKTALLLSALSALAELLPLAFSLDLLLGAERSLNERALCAARRWTRFVGLGVIALATQALLLLAASLLDSALKAALHAADERLVALAPLLLFALSLLACLWVNGVLDLARAALSVSELGARAALSRALVVLREQPLAVLTGSYASAAAASLGYLVAAYLTCRVDLTRAAGLPIAVCFLLHQAALLFGIAWRVRWLKQALTLSRAPAGSASRD